MVKYVADFFVFSGMKLRYCLSFLLLTFYTSISGQPTLSDELKTIRQLADSMLRGSTDAVKDSCNALLINSMEHFLQNPASFETSFDNIKSISTLTTDDKCIRFYQWATQVYATNSYKITGFVQMRDRKTKLLTFWKLKNSEEDKYTAMGHEMNTGNWFACIYYKCIITKFGKDKVYTLLGWRGNNTKTSMKIIDVLTIKGNIPVFGKKIFTSPATMLPVGKSSDKFRIIFEYNANAVMTLRYGKKRIVFDHISPAKPALKGNEEFYGPDFSYDAFRWKNKKWEGVPDIDIRNKHNTDGKKPKLIKDRDLKQ